jgi:hypothetical protein
MTQAPPPPQTPQPQPQRLSQTYQEQVAEKEHSDVQNRERISLAVLGISILSILIVSITYINQSANKESASSKVMDSTLPLYGTWVGTILAFYFSRNSFEAASSANSQNAFLFQQATSGLASSPPLMTP